MNKETLKNYLGKRILHIQGCETPEDLDMARIYYCKDEGNIMIRYSNKFTAECALDIDNPIEGLMKAAEFYRNFSISEDFVEDYQEFINFCDGAPVNKRMFFYCDHEFVPVISFQEYKHQKLEEQAKELKETCKYFIDNGMKNTKLFTVLKKEKDRIVSELDREDLEELYKDECDSYNDYGKYIFDDPATNAYDTVKWYITHIIPLELESIAEELKILLGENKKDNDFDYASDYYDYVSSDEYEELLKNLDRTVETVNKIVSAKKGKGGKK